MTLRGHPILIVESDAGPFIAQLQAAVEGAGAECLVARDPPTALERCERFDFSAALVNAEFKSLSDQLDIAVLLYARSDTLGSIVTALERLLGG
jgi:hypothetical protein